MSDTTSGIATAETWGSLTAATTFWYYNAYEYWSCYKVVVGGTTYAFGGCATELAMQKSLEKGPPFVSIYPPIGIRPKVAFKIELGAVQTIAVRARDIQIHGYYFSTESNLTQVKTS